MPEFEVRLFAHLKDRHGERVRVHAEPSAARLLEALRAAGIETRGCRLAANLEFASGDVPLNEGDELGLIPPVSGG